ncbi:hypothetical protein CVV68_11455 [Arthrobacter livingstonensis]|uniref:Uncharacterized protein n=1 Tax=Arthrobacter livingstonensis TaxID=670078 RepID=A0A2V5L6M4_9MICC|nr:hypothetical protein CVV68_11455 [Arthrobacter livingstonensis]
MHAESIADKRDDGLVAVVVQHGFGDPQLLPAKPFHEPVASFVNCLLPCRQVMRAVVFQGDLPFRKGKVRPGGVAPIGIHDDVVEGQARDARPFQRQADPLFRG